MKKVSVELRQDSRAGFQNNAAYCIGTGRMGLALTREYQEQLALAQAECHFSHIRGHGLFCDDMAIYQPWTDAEGVVHEGYNFTYLDRVMDCYREQNLRPFLELGFMPQKMASGTQTIFYWKGNTTPPADHEKWAAMIRATLRHLIDRYGYDEVAAWPCEVWNEPNLPGFWENADKAKYLQLYAVSARAVKEVLPEMKVGGPAICGGQGSQEWIRDFLTFCRDEKLPLDFVTRHAYMAQTPTKVGRYTYHEMCTVDFTVQEMTRSREIIDSFPEFKGMPLHITEFNTSYNPLCPIHDTNLNAAYIAGLLARLGDVAASYSYWTFGDVFEEQGVPSQPFHGGFGLIANGLIPKPTLWTFAFFNRLRGEGVYRDEHCVAVRNADGSLEGVAWNLCRESREKLELQLTFPAEADMTLTCETVDEECCNPLKNWHEMGEPASLNEEQLRLLRKSAQPLCSVQTVHPADGEAQVCLTLGENGLTYFKLAAKRANREYGYDYNWYCEHA